MPQALHELLTHFRATLYVLGDDRHGVAANLPLGKPLSSDRKAACYPPVLEEGFHAQQIFRLKQLYEIGARRAAWPADSFEP